MATGISSPLALGGMYPSVDGRYVAANGKPFTSVSNAESALNGFPSKLSESCVGLTVLVKESGWAEAKEYWVQPKGTTPETYGLVEKGAGTTDYNDLDNKPTIGDGTNTALPIVGNVKVSASTASGSTAGVTVTPGQNTGEIEMQFTLPKGDKGEDGADGQDGAPGHNPCLGRFPAVPNPMPNGQIGDYLYVDITTVDPNTQEETTTTTVYHYGSNGWDNGAAIDAEHPTLASGQDVTAVHIKDENGVEVQGTADVLSAEAGKALKDEFKKKWIYISTPQNYEDDVAEFYFRIETEEQVVLKSYAGKVYAQTKSGGIIANGTVSENNVCYPISIYQSNDTNYPVGSIFGYVVFKNIEHFLANPTSSVSDVINSSYCGILGNFPIIDSSFKFATINGSINGINIEVGRLTGEVENINDSLEDLYIRYTVADFVQGYTRTYQKNIGDVITKVSTSNPYTSDSSAGQLVIPVKANQIVVIKLRDLTNQFCRNWILTDTDYHVLSWAEDGVHNWIESPQFITVGNDGFLFIQITQAYYQYNSVGLEIRTKDTLVELIDKRIEDFGINSNNIEVCVPDEINAVVGDTLQLYYRSIFRCVDYSQYDVNITCSVGAQYPRYYEIVPIASQIGDYNIRFRIYDNNHKLLGEKSSTLKIRQKVNSPASELNVLCVGASATAGGQWASEFKRRLVGTSGLPIGSEVSNVIFVGRMDKTFEGKQVNLEATGGYSFNSYNSISTARYRFNVATFEGLLINVDDVYSNNGHNFTVKEINSTDNYFSCEGDGTPETASTSNPKTLTKVSGTGSETISYISTSFSGNPFVYNGAINIQQYADDFCNPQQAEHGRIDVVYTELFGNGTPAYGENMATRMESMQTFINNILAVFPNCKFCIGLFWNPDVKGGMGVNYGATGDWADPYAIKYSNMNMCNELQEYINTNNLGDKVYILNWLNEFDEENDMMQTTKKVNPRSSVTEIFGVNGVHPAVVGYNQMADSCWRLFITKFCQGS